MIVLIVYRTHDYFDLLSFFFFNDTATTEIYTLSLHDALPISECCSVGVNFGVVHQPDLPARVGRDRPRWRVEVDRKSTRLKSSQPNISDAVFCLKKKKTRTSIRQLPRKR